MKRSSIWVDGLFIWVIYYLLSDKNQSNNFSTLEIVWIQFSMQFTFWCNQFKDRKPIQKLHSQKKKITLIQKKSFYFNKNMINKIWIPIFCGLSRNCKPQNFMKRKSFIVFSDFWCAYLKIFLNFLDNFWTAKTEKWNFYSHHLNSSVNPTLCYCW